MRASSESSSPEQSTMLWERLSAHLERFIDAWEESSEPPTIADFLPASPPGLRRLGLVELIKLDLEYRWQNGQRKLIEDYAGEFPELAPDGLFPQDLIYEEHHVRKQCCDPIESGEYARRFPRQAAEIARLLEAQNSHATTALLKGEKLSDLEVGQSIDDFDLLAQLGRGAFGSVFLARQRSMQRLVALKVSGDRGVEGQTMAQLDHPHIVRVYDQRVLPERKLRLLYMQYVAGGTLHSVAERVRRTPPEMRDGKLLLAAVDQALDERGESPPTDSGTRRRLSNARWPEVVCWIGARLARALEYAHGRGVLHRDIKPANVLVAADGTPKLADFNISFSSGLSGASAAAYFGGSLAYMSPEQLEAYSLAHGRTAEDLDARSDVYSLGVMLWELLTGTRPFADAALEGDMTAMVAQMIARRLRGVDPLFIEQAKKVAPEAVVEVLLRCLAPNRDARYADAAGLARQMEIALQPHAQRLMRPPSRGWKPWVRRHPLLALIAAGVVPNAVMSVLNIVFNLKELVEGLSDRQIMEFFLSRQLAVVNGIAYPLGILIVTVMAWPLFKAFRHLRRDEPPLASEFPQLCRCCLRIGDWMAIVSIVEWIISGRVFPAWLHQEFGDKAEEINYAGFMASQVLCGILAGSLTYFCASFLCVRVLLPALISPEISAETGLPEVMSTGRRAWWYFWGTVVVIPGVGVAFEFLGMKQRGAIYVTAGGGLLCSFFAWKMVTIIRGDLAALAPVMAPSQDVSSASTEGLDSFWSGTR